MSDGCESETYCDMSSVNAYYFSYLTLFYIVSY